jgi:hypothetical protein
MKIGDVLTYHGRPVVVLGMDPMSVSDRQAIVRDVDTDEVFDVPFDELEDGEGLAPTR